MITAAAVARSLAEAGIDRVFGLPGGEVLVLIDELRKAGVDFVLMRHEANAGIAASVYGKIKRQPGVVIATLGPGAANLLLPLHDIYQPIARVVDKVTQDNVDDVVDRALTACMDRPYGVSYLTLSARE